MNRNQVVAVLGEHNWKKDEKTEQYMSIAEIHFPIQYNPLANTYDADIAVFKFTKQVIFTDYVIPVCLPTTSADSALSNGGHTGRVSGWGARSRKFLNTTKSRAVKTLHKVEVPIVNHTTCRRNHVPKYFISTNMLCAGRTDGKGDACQGDSGGPLTVENRATRKHILVGVVSWGDRCGDKGKYGVYTKVLQFVRWINSYIRRV